MQHGAITWEKTYWQTCSSEAVDELKTRNLDFLPFSDLEEEVKKDVKYLQDAKLVPNNVAISGWIYEVETGKTRRVV